ncbi:radical SAM protein [Acidobacteriota bacterium]
MKSNFIKHFIRLPTSIIGGIVYKLGGFLFTPKPRMIQFPVSDRCNAKCMMCNRWQTKSNKDIELEKIREVFSGRFFSQVEDVSLHGGEPTLRRDLAEICDIIQKACPRLKRIWISTNGFGPERIEKRITEILAVLNFNKIDSLEINVSIDGPEEIHDRIRGVKGGFKQCLETIQCLKRATKNHPAKIGIGTILLPINIDKIDKMEQLALDLDVPIMFQPVMFDEFFNISDKSSLVFGDADRGKLRKLIEKKFIEGTSTTSFYWNDYLSMMNGGLRKSPCAFDRYVLSLYPTGDVLPCSQKDWIMFGNVYDQPAENIWKSGRAKAIRKRMKKEVCPTCSAYCGVEFSLQKEFFSYLVYYVKKKLSVLNS